METTRLTLLEQIRGGDQDAWDEVDRMYRPLIFNWLRRFELQFSDAEDLAQEVMALLHREIPQFEHNGRVGAFRYWLRTVTCNRARSYLRSQNNHRFLSGSSVFQEMVQQLAEPDSEISREFDREHDRFVIGCLLDEIAGEIAESTMTAFRRHVVVGEDATVVARDLGLSPTTVLVAKSRVLRRLRERAENWLNETVLFG